MGDVVDTNAAKLSEYAYEPTLAKEEMFRNQQFNVNYIDDEFMSVSQGDYLYNVHRGTSNVDDLMTDISLAIGGLENTDRYDRSFRKSYKFAREFGEGKRIVEVGHSLGGTIAETIAQKLNHESRSFNPGVGLGESDFVSDNRHKRFRMRNDAVSMLGKSDAIHHTSGKKRHRNPRMEKLESINSLPIKLAKLFKQSVSAHTITNFN